MSDLTQRIVIEGQGNAAAVVKTVTASLEALNRQLGKTADGLKRAFGTDMLKPLAAVRGEAKAFGVDLTDAAERAAKALRVDVAAVAELRTALRGAVAEQKALAEAVRASQAANSNAARSQATAARNAASARATASRDTVRDVGRVWRIRERSEAAEMRHLRAVGRERSAMRRKAMQTGRHAYGHASRAVRSINHPVHESVGFALTAGAAFGAAAAEHIVAASEAFDSSMARLRMFAPQFDADAIRKQSLGDSISLGVDASKIVDTIAKSVRDGVPAEVAKTLPKSIVQTAQVMGGDIERLTDSLAEGIQESTAMGWIKNQADARRFLNLEAGLSTTAGNTSEKTEQFIAAGGLGHGKEMGLDLEKTMAFGAMLNASGARTGQASARFMGQLSQNVPKMYDKYRTAVDSRKNSEEDRAVRSAPSKLGYGGIREMRSRIMAGPEGLIDFATRLQKLDDKARKLVLEGYGFSEQGGAMLAELGSNGGAKGKAVLARAHELAAQKEANDYLSEKFAEWQKSLSFMLKQIEAGWRAIENEIGDTIKDDVIAPLRDWWIVLSSAIVNSDLKGRLHAAIAGFVHGLGFDDVRQLLDAMTAGVHGFDFARFARGVGEGIRAVVDEIKSLASVFGGAGGLSAETVGRISTEFLGLSLALRFVAPVINTIAGVASAFLAIKAAVEFGGWVARLSGLADGVKGLAALDMAGAASGLLSIAGALGALVGAITLAQRAHALEMPKGLSGRDVLRFLDPGLADRLLPNGRTKDDATLPKGPPTSTLSPSDYWAKKNRYLHPSSYGGGESWRDLLTPASYSPSDSGDVARNAMVDTARGVVAVREAVDRLGVTLRTATLSGSGGDGSEGEGRPSIRYGHQGAMLGGGTENMRYGHGGGSGGGRHGSYRSTPGSGQAREIGPHVSLGKMGSKFAAKAPVIMDGLMKKYGLTREQAAGVLGNLGHESAGFTAYHEGGQAAAKGGVGWAQWTGPRRRAFEKWVAEHHLNPTSDEASWRYLTEGDPETARAILAVKRTTNRRDAVRAFHDSFERSADISHGVIVKQKSWNSRLNYADKAFAGTPGGATVTADKPLGTPENPVVVKPDPKAIVKGVPSSPADIAGKAPTYARPRPGTGDVPAGSMTTSDSSTTTHHWHVHGEPARQTVLAHLPSRRGGSTIDLDAFASA